MKYIKKAFLYEENGEFFIKVFYYGSDNPKVYPYLPTTDQLKKLRKSKEIPVNGVFEMEHN